MMLRQATWIVVLFLLIHSSLIWGQSPTLLNNAFQVIEFDASKVVYILQPFDLRLTPFPLDNATYHLVTVPGFGLTTVPGFPMLPVTGALIQIPSDAELFVTILESQYEELTGIDLPPAPEIQEDSTSENISFLYKKKASIYSSDIFWPTKLAEISGKGRWRGLNIGRIQMNPIQYNPVQKILRVYKTLKIQVQFSKPLKRNTKGGGQQSDVFENLTKSVLLNYDKSLQSVSDKNLFKTKIKTTTWYNPQATYYKLLVGEEGIYSLTYEELLNAGLEVDLLDLNNLKILYQGKQIPIWIEGPLNSTLSPQNTIYFYGDRHHGSDTYFDLYTDTNVYWLTTDGGIGKRYQLVMEDSLLTNEEPFYWETLHFEKDSFFYRWNSSSSIDPGEGWVWRYLFDNEGERFNFHVSGLYESVSACSLKVRVQGTTKDPVKPDHHIQLFINDQVGGEAYFDDREELIWELSFPTSLLHDGMNKFELHLVPDTGAQLNQIYLDWIEIVYPRVHAAQNSNLKFQNPNPSSLLTQYSVVNFDSSDIFIFNPRFAKVWKPETQKASFYRVESAGFDDGKYVRIEADFKIYDNWDRGHNLVAINHQTREIITTNFDTYTSSDAADEMANFINSLPEGSVVLVGILDEGSANMTEKAYQALESLGSALTREVSYRDSWAIVGWKGAPVGTVEEVLSKRFSGPAFVEDTLRNEQAYHFSASFKDTATSGSFYYGVSGRGFKKVLHIQKDKSSDLQALSNGADYIIITHENFIKQAERLAEYRRDHNGFRSVVVDVQDIYDEFNGGIIHPQAIKDFLYYAYLNWERPVPSYVVLFGDASWDPKMLMKESKKINYVPIYGDPVTDNWFVAFDGPDDVLPEMFIGRIPVETAEQADVVVNKIVSYEKLSFDAWNKEFVFLNGGINSTEQNIFFQQANTLIKEYIETSPFNGEAIQFNKTTDEAITVSFRNVAADKINKGVLWVNFLGHAGSAVWDIDIGQPEDWRNTEIFPFMTGMSCHSARFANPVMNSLSEKYVLNSMGASAYWGSTGFGYVTQDFYLLDGLLPVVTKDTVRSVGEATTLAKVSLWLRLGDQSRNRNVIHQYNLIGDPALNFVLSTKPELAINSGEIRFESDFLLTTDSSSTVSAKIRNYGLTPEDSVDIQFSVIDPGGNQFTLEFFKIKPIGFVDSVAVSWNIPNFPGLYRLQVQVDPTDLIEEEDDLNNVAEKQIYVYSSQLTILKPLEFGLVNTSTPELVTNNTKVVGENIIYYFEVDTSLKFNSPLLMQSDPIPEGKLVTKWSPQLSRIGVYYWRVRTFDGENYGPWESSSFTYLPLSNFQWQQSTKDQFIKNHLENVNSSLSDEIELQQIQFIYKAESAGFNDGNSAVLSLNKEVFGQNLRGHNLAVFDESNGTLLFTASFDTWVDPANAEAMAEFINSLQEGQIVLAAIRDEGSWSMTESAYSALESLGSALTRQVGYRDSWAIIGRKGAAMGSVPEAMSKAGEGRVVIADTLYRFKKSGTMISTEIGPALGWKLLHLSYNVTSPEDRIQFQIIGQNHETGQWDSLMSAIKDVEQVNLSNIDAKIYPKIKLETHLLSADGLNSPQLNSWALDFKPPPDLAVGKGSISLSRDSVFAGADVGLKVEAANFGLSPTDSFTVRILRSDPVAGDVELNRLRMSGISIDQYKTLNSVIPTKGLLGKTKITVEVDADHEIPEIDENNNSYFTNLWVAQDTLFPEIRVTFDGREVGGGEFVSANPEIVVELRDKGTASFTDTSFVSSFLDGERIVYGSKAGQAQLIPQNDSNDPDLKALVIFTPQLTDGEHTLEIVAKDASGNLRTFQNQFYVSSKFLIANVMNYPNPFRTETDFTYVLTQPADEVRIKIYTISGRLIRELDFIPTQVGFNQFHWNGRDHDGDALSNGVYLYKIIARKSDQQVEIVEKFVVMR
ncbi:MAG: C25 family cysteine peptidase [bacterium]